MTTPSHQTRQVSYFLEDIDGALVVYDRIRWHKSDTETGPYLPATSAAAAVPTLTGSRQEPFDVQGLSLLVKIDNVDVEIAFTGGSALTAAEVVTQIGLASVLLSASAVGTAVKIDGVQTGTDAALEIVGGDAAAFLGFTVGSFSLGTDADTVLVSDTHEYFLTDYNAQAWYRIELLHHTSGASTGQGPAFPSPETARTPYSDTIVCTLRLCDMQGAAVPGRRVTFANVGVNRVNTTWALGRQYFEALTDSNGYLEVRLVRGALIDMSIDSLGVTRRIRVPTTGDAVDLLDPALVTEDEFGIQEQSIPALVRMS